MPPSAGGARAGSRIPAFARLPALSCSGSSGPMMAGIMPGLSPVRPAARACEGPDRGSAPLSGSRSRSWRSPMPSDADFMAAMLGRQLGMFSAEALRSCSGASPESPGKALAEILAEKGHITKQGFKALMLLVADFMGRSGGDRGRAAASLPVQDEIRLEVMACLGIAPPPLVEAPSDLPSRGGSGLKARGGTTRLRKGRKDKYEFRGELGRGGVSRVVEAVDTDFGREVAVKMMLPESIATGDLEAFLAEGRIAGRLPHPNIVPVYDMGVLKEAGVDTPFFTMAKISGRNLSQVLLAVWEGGGKTAEEFTPTRLLGIFQDVCNAVEYAHDHGVIHRDLKPSNVMVGDYGEVFVVDWGLAKEKQQPEVLRRRKTERAEAGDITWESEIMGSPAYMPPEQADGKLAEIDERSDVYSLGAILYQMLTLRAPFEGANVYNLIDKVLSGAITPPSKRVGQIKSLAAGKAPAGSADSRRLPSRPDLLRPVPPELDRICLKAMSRRKEDRHASARALNSEIAAFLEGERERERNKGRAAAKITEGRALLGALEAVRDRINDVELQIIAKRGEVRPHWPLDRKKELWDLEEKFQSLSDESVSTYARAGRALQAALEFDRDNPDARAALADMYWRQFLFEEDKGNRKEMLFCENLAREYNDGRYDEKIRGDGTLSVSARSYPCRCLLDGRFVAPDELAGSAECRVSSAEKHESPSERSAPNALRFSQCGMMGYHPFSGRALDGRKGGEGVPGLEPREPLRLRIHGPGCRTEPLPGADAWLFRLEERDRILVPVFPEGVKGEGAGAEPQETSASPFHASTLPPSLLDRLYDPGSPFRPAEGLYLGKTPIPPFKIPMGSYLLIIAMDAHAGSVQCSVSGVQKQNAHDPRPESRTPQAENAALDTPHSTLNTGTEHEYSPVRVPVKIGRMVQERLVVNLYREDEIPEGFVQVPQGGFTYQGDRNNPYSEPQSYRWVDDFFISKHPVRCREYLEFLNEIAAQEQSGGARRGRTGPQPAAETLAPRKASASGIYWPRDAAGRFVIPTAGWMEAAPADLRAKAVKLEMSLDWWHPDWPVFGISWEDLTAFAAWASRRAGRVLSLPHEMQWEKAARGPDCRIFPWGDFLDGTFCNVSVSHADGLRPCPVDSFPVDESPHGARGMGGNAREGCINAQDDGTPVFRVCRGGCWPGAPLLARSTSRTAFPPGNVNHYSSGRLVCMPRLGGQR